MHLHYQMRLPEDVERAPHTPAVVLGMLPVHLKADSLAVIAVRHDESLARETRRFRVDIARASSWSDSLADMP
jgi:hypothetical protein